MQPVSEAHYECILATLSVTRSGQLAHLWDPPKPAAAPLQSIRTCAEVPGASVPDVGDFESQSPAPLSIW